MEIEDISVLVSKCKEAFEKEFGEVPTIGAKAPGRVNIIGEHTDYNDGFVFPMVSLWLLSFRWLSEDNWLLVGDQSKLYWTRNNLDK